MRFEVYKYHHLGNDVILFHKDSTIKTYNYALMAHRKKGIGADQLMRLDALNHETQTIELSIFNNDGSKVDLCVNGLLCLGLHVQKNHPEISHWSVVLGKQTIALDTRKVIKTTLAMDDFSYSPDQKTFIYQKESLSIHECFVGNRHVLVFSTQDPYNFSSLDFIKIYGEVNAVLDTDDGFNFSLVFVKSVKDGVVSMRVRTYERGVGETDACGSAAVACAYNYNALNKQAKHFKVYPLRGGMDVHVLERCIEVLGRPNYVAKAFFDDVFFKENQ